MPSEANPIPTLFQYNNYGNPLTERSCNSIKKRQSRKSEKDVARPGSESVEECSVSSLNRPDCAITLFCDEVFDTLPPVYPCKEETVKTDVENNILECLEIQYDDEEAACNNYQKTADHGYSKLDFYIRPEPRDTYTQSELTGNDMDNFKDLYEKQEQEVSRLEALLEDDDYIMRTIFVKKLMKSDSTVKQYTGIPSKQMLDEIFALLDELHPKVKYWIGSGSATEKNYQQTNRRKPGPSRKLTRHQEYLITLIKLRTGFPNFVLSSLFGVADSRVSQVFCTWINVMNDVFAELIQWPSKKCIKKHMPPSFKKSFPKTTAIIDCTEINIHKPRLPTAQSQTYSTYKSHNTFKALVAITPTGAFSFVSDFWGGNVSDRFITTNCGFLELVKPGDEIMADRGFIIRDLLTERKATLNIPPFTRKCSWGKGKRLNSAEVKKTKDIAKLRIHVERAIGRLKCFRFLSTTLNLKYKRVANQCLKVAGFLCNLSPPLVRK